MNFILPKIYPITDTGISGLSHTEQVHRLIAGGASLIQLRDKKTPVGEFYSDAADAVSYAQKHGVKILINDRVDVAVAVGADGVHLGQDDLSPEHARELLGEDAIIGFSTHSTVQAREALTLPIDYIAIGPVFGTSSKADPDPVLGLEALRAVRDIVGDFPLVAIGGINRDNAPSVFAAGADSLAIIRDILFYPDNISARLLDLTNIS